MGPGLRHTVALGARMLTQTHVASSCGLVSVARARRGEGGWGARAHSVCPCYIARHVAGLSQAVKGKLFLLGEFLLLVDAVSGTSLTGVLALHKTMSSSCPRVRPPWPSCRWGGLQPSTPPLYSCYDRWLCHRICYPRSGVLVPYKAYLCLECIKQTPNHPGRN